MINETLEYIIYLKSNLHWGRIVCLSHVKFNAVKTAFFFKDKISIYNESIIKVLLMSLLSALFTSYSSK